MLSNNNATGAAGRKPPRAPDARWPQEARGYEKERELGTGSFATVDLVHVRGALRQKAALKTIELTGFDDQKWVRLCRAEVQALQQLDHPNIIKCYASIEDEESRRGLLGGQNGTLPGIPTHPLAHPPPNTRLIGRRLQDAQKRARLLLVLEFASRGNLEQLITDTYFTKQRRLPEAQIWRLFAQIAAAIAHVHERRILHRDLKPANVLFDGPQMAVKVCDFGLCRLFSQNTVRANTQVGTPYYVSPERSTQSGYNFASDVWSLGCILYEMACGGSPFVGERSNEFALNLRIQAADFPPLPDGERRTPHLKLLVRLCLQVDTGRRPAAAQVQRFAEKMAAFFQ
ncbi:hypothetical protein M3Y99_00260800 [Aphelenchoides fujianensis]|nr:hypothetical protein M3Y99_00260800 [Aphelenchoides fujianensis]